MEQGQRCALEPPLAREDRGLADVAGEHPGALHLVQRAVERLRERGLDQALAQPDAKLAGDHADDAARGARIGPGEERRQQIGLARRSRGGLDGGERRGDLHERR
jgi:hypothetical protein